MRKAEGRFLDGLPCYLAFSLFTRKPTGTGNAQPKLVESTACRPGTALVLEDEASFRQGSTLAQTWARRGQAPRVPVSGERHSIKGLAA